MTGLGLEGAGFGLELAVLDCKIAIFQVFPHNSHLIWYSSQQFRSF